jgi:spore coat polysaccharide biosynthesis protein SpsF (cytidylyltransferase family)
MKKKVLKRVAIAIQARLCSTRFPRKSVQPLSDTGITPITSLIQNCTSCAKHVESKNDPSTEVNVDVWVLVPESEVEEWNELIGHKDIKILAGNTTNVLSRYIKLMEHRYDYIMRLTSDCPNVPQLAMNKAIWTAIYHNLDYCSNAWEKYRTAIDGHDIEVISSRALEWLSNNAHTDSDREHVTIAIREQMPVNLKKSALIQKEDLSGIKICIDTEDEYLKARDRFQSAINKKRQAVNSEIYVYEY